MNLYRLKRKNITLGASGPRYMFVAARDEEQARRVAESYKKPLQYATDPREVSCEFVTSGGTDDRPRVLADDRFNNHEHTAPPHWRDDEGGSRDSVFLDDLDDEGQAA